MSPRLPALKAADVIRALERAGFVVRRTRGSHFQLVHVANPELRTTVPRHNRDLKRGTLHGILRDCNLSVDEFLGIL